jgi:hypothetical protein
VKLGGKPLKRGGSLLQSIGQGARLLGVRLQGVLLTGRALRVLGVLGQSRQSSATALPHPASPSMRGMGVIGVMGGCRGVSAFLRHKKQDFWYIIGYFTLAEARADIDSSGICLFQNPNTKYAGIGGNRGCGGCASR